MFCFTYVGSRLFLAMFICSRCAVECHALAQSFPSPVFVLAVCVQIRIRHWTTSQSINHFRTGPACPVYHAFSVVPCLLDLHLRDLVPFVRVVCAFDQISWLLFAHSRKIHVGLLLTFYVLIANSIFYSHLRKIRVNPPILMSSCLL